MGVIGTHDDNSVNLLSHVLLWEYSKILMWGRTPEMAWGCRGKPGHFLYWLCRVIYSGGGRSWISPSYISTTVESQRCSPATLALGNSSEQQDATRHTAYVC